jgi:hypothetical protein
LEKPGLPFGAQESARLETEAVQGYQAGAVVSGGHGFVLHVQKACAA